MGFCERGVKRSQAKLKRHNATRERQNLLGNVLGRLNPILEPFRRLWGTFWSVFGCYLERLGRLFDGFWDPKIDLGCFL